MSFAYIRDFYGVPAKRGEPVMYRGKRGRVTGSHHARVTVRLEGETRPRLFHPTDLEWPNLKEIDQA